jgi:riboflavin kinase/FMN adenylyltransferase
MTVYNNIEQLPAFKNAIITIGTFDGVHTGHQQIIQLMKQEAAKVKGETVIITFHPHPRMVVASQKPNIQLLNTLEEKILLLQDQGLDNLVIVPFTEDFANQSAEEYIADFLVKRFQPHTIIIGHDHHFGKGRTGDYELLEQKGAEFNYKVVEIPVHMLEDITISSTKIREAIVAGDIDTASKYLDYAYFFSGKVIEGNKLGRTIGFPTANLEVENRDKLVPGNGVYAVEIKIAHSIENPKPSVLHRSLKGMMNIGVRPTVDGNKKTIEVNIFDFNEAIYGQTITVTLKKHLRSEQKFSGLDALKEQLAKDKLTAIAALA